MLHVITARHILMLLLLDGHYLEVEVEEEPHNEGETLDERSELPW
jgi:hypothetical protein